MCEQYVIKQKSDKDKVEHLLEEIKEKDRIINEREEKIKELEKQLQELKNGG
eukprot:Pgem_evm1s7230